MSQVHRTVARDGLDITAASSAVVLCVLVCLIEIAISQSVAGQQLEWPGSCRSDEDPCSAMALSASFQAKEGRLSVCVDGQGRPILWKERKPRRYGCQELGWHGTKLPMPPGRSSDDLIQIEALASENAGLVLLLFRDGSLFSWDWSAPDLSLLESTGVRELFRRPGLVFYSQSSVEESVSAESLYSISGAGQKRQVWSFEGRHLAHVFLNPNGEGIGVLTEFKEHEEEWLVDDSGARLVQARRRNWELPLEAWEPVERPTLDPGEVPGWLLGQWSLREENDHIVAASPKPERRGDEVPFWVPLRRGREGERIALRVDNGFLLGFDMGEWGGGLWFFDPAGKQSYPLFADSDPVNDLLDLGHEVVAVSRGASRVRFEGQVRLAPCLWRLHKAGDRWEVRETLKCDGVYASSVQNDGSLLFASPTALHRYRDGGIERLHEFRGSIAPISMLARSETEIWLGLVNAVVRLDRSGTDWSEQWFAPPRDPDPDSERCREPRETYED